MGILIVTIASRDSGKQQAAVYVPTAPQTKLGLIRIGELDDFQFTISRLRKDPRPKRT